MNKLLIIIALSLPFTALAEDTVPDSLATEAQTAEYVSDTIPNDSLADSIVEPLHSIFDVMTNVIIHQDSLVRQLILDRASGREKENVEVAGYRVQIYSSNRQQEAKMEAMRLEKEMLTKLDVPVYVNYAPPFWKVRIGDFATYEEAQEFKNSFIREFPELMGDTYVVRDQVILKQ